PFFTGTGTELNLTALAPVALLSSHRFILPNGLLQNASGAVVSGFTDQVLTSTLKSKQVDGEVFQPPRPYSLFLEHGSEAKTLIAPTQYRQLRRLLQLMNTQLNDIYSRKQSSILRANMKDKIMNFDFEVFLRG
ncbi:unnamed protein product, partial [Porites evermanni]